MCATLSLSLSIYLSLSLSHSLSLARFCTWASQQPRRACRA